MAFRLGHANVEQPDTDRDEAITIADVTDRSDVVTLNECHEASTHKMLRSLRGWDCFIPPKGAADENCILWRTGVFERFDAGSHVVMTGGIHNHRRRGPSRGVTWVVLREAQTKRRFILVSHHSIAKWQTTAKWRRTLALQGFRNVAQIVLEVMAKHPNIPVILCGDLNVIGKVTFAFTGMSLKEVATPPTYGKQRYDRILHQGRVRISQVRAITTKSDHRALLAHVSLGAAK